MPLVTKLRGKAADLVQGRESTAHERVRLEAQLAQLKCAPCLPLRLIAPENVYSERNAQKTSLGWMIYDKRTRR